MSDQNQQHRHDDSNKLRIMAMAVEHMQQSSALSSPAKTTSAAAVPIAAPDQQTSAPMPMVASPSRRIKLVLPTLTPAMQQDLALSKGTSGKGSKPLSIGTRPEYVDYLLIGIVTPHPNDVLCGRGGGSNNHPGNESFRELVNEVKFPYVNCPKREKPLIARRIVEAVRNQTPPGRFLSKDCKSGLWNDIGDGKAREKTSQALREGAPIIRDMIGKPTSPTNVATVLKEAKKAERAEKEYGVKLENGKGRSPGKNDDASIPSATAHAHHDHVYSEQVPHSLPLPEYKPLPGKLKRGKSTGSNISPPNYGLNQGVGPMPPLKKFRSLGEKDILGAQDITSSAPIHAHPPPAPWSHHMPQQQQPPPPRNFNNMMPYAPPHSAHQHHAGPMMGGYPPQLPPRGPVDYPSSGMPPRHPSAHPSAPDTVSVETVRRLLLGQLDPVQLAMQLLPPEEAVIVARRHAAAGLQHLGMMGRPPPPGSSPTTAAHPLPLAPLVSDGSSASSSGGSEFSTSTQSTNMMQRAPSDQSTSMMQRAPSDQSTSMMRRIPSDQITSSVMTMTAHQGGGDDTSSVDSSKQSSNGDGKRALPKKKRKYIQETQ